MQISVLLILIFSSIFSIERVDASLKYDGQHYSPELGCYDSLSKSYRRELVDTLEKLQQVFTTQNGECLEFVDIFHFGLSEDIVVEPHKPINLKGAKIVTAFVGSNYRLRAELEGTQIEQVYTAFYSMLTGSFDQNTSIVSGAEPVPKKILELDISPKITVCSVWNEEESLLKCN